MCIVRTAVMVCAVLGLAALPITVADARQAKKAAGASQAQAAGQDAEASLDKARRALDEGKPQTAQQLADAVLVSDKKDARGTARALAIRGEAHLQLGRPAEAISDLDSALWLKGGLSGRERELASAARSKAMQTGGVGNAAPVAQAQPSASHAGASSKGPGSPSAWNNTVTASSGASTPAPATPGSAPAPSGESQSSGGGISRFFSSLFGGGQSASPAPAATSAVTAPSPRTPAVSSSEPQRVGGAPPVAHAPPPSHSPRRAATAVVATREPPRSAPAPAASGKYALQLAAVRSRAEAQTMAQKVRAEKASLLGARKVEIVENVYGSMGRFYRVRIGPFAQAEQARSICESLRAGRMDCVVVDPDAG